MLRFIQAIYKRIKRVNWIPISDELIGRDNIFKIKFDNNWFYSVSGNSFYSIHNELDDLKGGIQISIIWNRPVVESIKDLNHLDIILQENEFAQTIRVNVSGLETIYFSKKYSDNNMDFHYWYLRFDNVYIKISYFIFEEEALEIREKWLSRVKKIIDTIHIDQSKFKMIEMK